MRSHGLTLVEILVALTVLAVGATGLVGLQLTTMRLAADSELRSRLLHVAGSELEARLLVPGAGGPCLAVPVAEREGIDCTVTVESCDWYLSGFACPVTHGSRARRVTVHAAADAGAQVDLSAVAVVPGGRP